MGKMVRDYTSHGLRRTIISSYGWDFPIDINVVTYNRLKYLEKCIWSIIASTSVPYQINVVDDGSTDGSQKWLKGMYDRKLISKIVLNKRNVGSVRNYNYLAEKARSSWLVFVNDDMWFHRFWDIACIDIINNYYNCGIVNFYNFSNLKLGKNFKIVDGEIDAMMGKIAGLGAAFIFKELFIKAGKYQLPDNKKMGYFATPFCTRVAKVKKVVRKRIYQPLQYYATNMDSVNCNLNEIGYSIDVGYMAHRLRYKRGMTDKQINDLIEKSRDKIEELKQYIEK